MSVDVLVDALFAGRVRSSSESAQGWCWLPSRCIQTYSVFSEPDWMFINSWNRVECSVAVAAIYLIPLRGATRVRKMGGFKQFVNKLGKAESERQIDRILLYGAGEITGVGQVKRSCSKW